MPKKTPRQHARSQVSQPRAAPIPKQPKNTPKWRHRRKLKANPTIPAIQAIPAGYEDDARAIRELTADGLPVTPEYIQLYKELEEELREAEILSSALGRLHVSHPWRTNPEPKRRRADAIDDCPHNRSWNLTFPQPTTRPKAGDRRPKPMTTARRGDSWNNLLN